MRKLTIILVLGLVACTSNTRMKNVHYDYLLADGNSKVWMIEQMVIDQTNITAKFDHQKELFIFFENGKFQYIPMQELGHKKGRIGTYTLDSQEKTLKLYFKEDIWHFKMVNITEESIYFKPLPDSKVEFSMELVPLKEIFFEDY